MRTPAEIWSYLRGNIRKEWKTAFWTVFILGLLIHFPVIAGDFPNHDGLASMYFDQNMITSGRWFLMAACGASSFFTVPWVIGLLGLLFLGLTAAALCELLEVRTGWAVVGVSGLLVSFPALASTFAYVFTLDGYMLALLLAVLAVLFTKKHRRGFLPGAVCLAFSLGTYQGYLAFAMILAVFEVLAIFCRERRETVRRPLGGCFAEALRYLYMGVLGAALYYVILQVLLKIQGKELDTYQGINGMSSFGAERLVSALGDMYRDFVAFTFRGNVLFQNGFGLCACILLAASAAFAAVCMAKRRKWWKNLAVLVIIGIALLALPVVTNVILLISPDVNYHLLMRYQWVLYLIGAVALAEKCGSGNAGVAEEKRGSGGNAGVAEEKCGTGGNAGVAEKKRGNVWRAGVPAEWAAFAAAFLLIFCYGLTDNIAYTNLQKRYEKTYAYCLRLLDRIEQTKGYYPGIPIAMVGVVGDEQFPTTDLTLPVTGNMIGMSGDVLLYTGRNYEAFISNYLGATLNILPADSMAQMYYAEEYMAMDSFPGENSIRIIDGVMYIKTENVNR